LSPLITVREYARLTTATVPRPSTGLAQVGPDDFDWLVAESDRLRAGRGAQLVQVEGRTALRLDNYVGVIATPSGTRIEILPKTTFDTNEATVAQARRILQKMLSRCLHLDPRISQVTALETYDYPLTEWVASSFLQSVDRLLKRGLRFDYHPVREELRFMRGRLQFARQSRQAPGRAQFFQVEHDVFDADRAENRLICSALDVVRKRTREPRNWRLAHALSRQLAEVPSSSNIREDLRSWRDDRLMAHYAPVRPWTTLILDEEMPLSVAGQQAGESMLFPMEKLFEQYVGLTLRRWLPKKHELVSQARRQHLCKHDSRPWFELRPDFLVTHDGSVISVIDAKWKLVDVRRNDEDTAYNLSQADFYQLFAYGEKYLGGRGKLVLLYPATEYFTRPLPSFDFHETLSLRVVPFDLERDAPIGEFM
jgi:5-methylcytosine-specific restriction enzyme subunit McrC